MACIHYSKFRNIQVRGLVSVTHGNCQVLASSDCSLVILAQMADIYRLRYDYLRLVLGWGEWSWG